MEQFEAKLAEAREECLLTRKKERMKRRKAEAELARKEEAAREGMEACLSSSTRIKDKAVSCDCRSKGCHVTRGGVLCVPMMIITLLFISYLNIFMKLSLCPFEVPHHTLKPVYPPSQVF